MNWPNAEAAALMAAHRWLSVLYSELGDAEWAEATVKHTHFTKKCAGFTLPPRAVEDGPDSLEEVRDHVRLPLHFVRILLTI